MSYICDAFGCSGDAVAAAAAAADDCDDDLENDSDAVAPETDDKYLHQAAAKSVLYLDLKQKLSACPIFSLMMLGSGLGALSCGVIASARSPGESVPGVAHSARLGRAPIPTPWPRKEGSPGNSRKVLAQQLF